MELRTDLVTLTSPSQAKIALFRSLFRGREDVVCACVVTTGVFRP